MQTRSSTPTWATPGTPLRNKVSPSPDTINGSPITPNTRKRKQQNYADLHNFGHEGPPGTPVTPAPTASATPTNTHTIRPTKKPKTLHQATLTGMAPPNPVNPPEASAQDVQNEGEADQSEGVPEKKKDRKRGWFWRYYKTTTLTNQWNKGKGKKKELVFD